MAERIASIGSHSVLPMDTMPSEAEAKTARDISGLVTNVQVCCKMLVATCMLTLPTECRSAHIHPCSSHPQEETACILH